MVRPSSAVRSTEGIGSILIMNTGQACIHNSAAQAALTHMACRGAPLPDDPGACALQLGLNLRQGGVVEVVPGGLLQGAERVPVPDTFRNVAGEQPVQEASGIRIPAAASVDQLQVVDAIANDRAVRVGDCRPRVMQNRE